MDEIFGSPEPSQSPQIDYGSLWSDYSTWERDIEEGYGAQLTDLDTRFKQGKGISAEAYMGERSRLESARDEELGALKRGPTYQLLTENWQASGGAGDMVSFYGGPTPRDRVDAPIAESAPSPKRGIASSGIQEAEGMLDRDKSSWFYV